MIRMFFHLAALSTELDDTYHFIKKVQFSDNAYANYMNLLIGTGYACSAILGRKAPDYDLKIKIFTKLLQYLRDVNQFI